MTQGWESLDLLPLGLLQAPEAQEAKYSQRLTLSEDQVAGPQAGGEPVSYTHLRAHET